MRIVILKNADLLSSLDIENLGRTVATSGNILAVMAETNAADDTLVSQGVYQVDVKDALDLRVENGVPVVASLLVVRCHSIDLKIS